MTLRVLSLGAGVQSSALLILAHEGHFESRPDVAIFADTGLEPEAVYQQVDRLRRHCTSVPVVVVQQGDLGDDLRAGGRVANPPFHILNRDGTKGFLNRACTSEYKITPIVREIRRLLGAKPRARIRTGAVEQWFGISTDEAALRMTDSKKKWIVNRYPLVEIGFDRGDCAALLRDRGFPAVKSACHFCPFRSDASWRNLRDHHPEAWADAVALDRDIREVGVRGVKGVPYVHRSLQPLSEVDLSTAEERGQGQLFASSVGGECDTGYCWS